MGSQSVTNFSTIRMNRIRELVKDYSPRSPSAEAKAKEIGALVVGTLEKGPTNEFLQALTSGRVVRAVDSIMSFADRLKEAKDPERVYEKYGISPKQREPLATVGAILTMAYSNRLSTTQELTDFAFAAKDAIPKTIIDIVSAAFPREKELMKVDRKKFAEAFRRVPRQQIVTAFLENVTAALINLALDASRGSFPPTRIAEVKKGIRERFVPEFIQRLKKGKLTTVE